MKKLFFIITMMSLVSFACNKNSRDGTGGGTGIQEEEMGTGAETGIQREDQSPEIPPSADTSMGK